VPAGGSSSAKPAVTSTTREDRPIITGEYLQDAKATRDPLTNQSVVNFTLSRAGGRIFERETGRHVNDYMAIILDGRVQGQPPIIKSQIGQRGQIELGAKPLQDAQDLALVLKAGALPAPLTIIEERTIGPSLGQDSIRDGIHAGIVGVALVVLIMVVYYRVSGLLAVAALVLYVVFTLGGLAGFGFTLTLPGLARRDRAGAGLRHHADHRDPRVVCHRRVRGPDLLHDLARPPAGHGHPERLR